MIYIFSTFRNNLHTIFYFTLPVLRIDKTDKMREITHMKKIISDIRSKKNCKIKIIFYKKKIFGRRNLRTQI